MDQSWLTTAERINIWDQEILDIEISEILSPSSKNTELFLVRVFSSALP